MKAKSDIWYVGNIQYYVEVELSTSSWSSTLHVTVSLFKREKGKRKWLPYINYYSSHIKSEDDALNRFREVEHFDEYAEQAYNNVVKDIAAHNPFNIDRVNPK